MTSGPSVSSSWGTGPWDKTLPRIRIVRRPEGEAPEWVRDAWIGVELVLLSPEPLTFKHTGGVLSGPRTYWACLWWRLMGRGQTVTGYVVDANEAVRCVGRVNPTAAIWWRAQAGSFVQPGQHFIFDVPACERID